MARAMATINNLVLGIFAKQGYDNIPKARRFYDANFDQALSLLC
jgi:hypothetical protein